MSSPFEGFNKKLIVISGPTASGKTGLSLGLSRYFDAEIFSADSRQIYNELTIGTAKPDLKTLASTPHHFINHISIKHPYSVGKYAREMKEALDVYFSTRDIAIVVGGTGLYLKVLLEGMDDLPPTDLNVLSQLQTSFEVLGLSFLQEQLSMLDPDYYQVVDIQNPRRLMRALAVSLSTGKPYSSFLKQETGHKLTSYHTFGIILDPPRETLYRTINDRVDNMILMGLEEEAQKLMPFREHQALQTVGYSEWFDYFDKKISRERVVELIKQNSRRYAKRQVTWFKKFGIGRSFPEPDLDTILPYLLEEMRKRE